MEDINIKLSLIWIALMLVYLLGDVVRIFAGDFKAGEMDGKSVPQYVYLGVAAIMVLPIVMVVLSILLPDSVNRWVNIIVAIIFLLFNLAGIKGYKIYDIFLLIISFGFNFLTIYFAWKWV